MSEHDAPVPDAGAREPRAVVLAALLDTLLPPRTDTPGGGDEKFVRRVLADASGGPLAAALELVLDQVGPDFAARSTPERERAFALVEEQDPDAAAAVVNLAYTAYYTDRRVLRTLERTLDYRAVPPQPQGFALPASPWNSLLHTDREHLPLWRSR